MTVTAAKEAEMVERPKSKFAEYLMKVIDASDVKQREIAAQLGYKYNLITMFKQGLTRVPLDKVPALARALGLNEMHLMNMALREYLPHVHEAIQKVYGRGVTVTDNEMDIIEFIREASKETDPHLSPALKAKIKEGLKEGSKR